MGIYIGLLLYLFAISLIARILIKEKSRQDTIILKFVLGAMFLICSLRGTYVGIDTYGYKSIYEITAAIPWNNFDYVYFEYGYILLMKLFILLGAPFNVFLMGVYAVVFIPIYFFLKRYSKNVVMSLLVYICFTFFTFNLTGIRNSMGLSICLLAFMFLEKKNFKSLIITCALIFLAFGFHKSAIVFVMVIIAAYFPFELKTSWIYVLCSVILIYQPALVFNFANDYMDRHVAKSGSLELGGAFIFYLVIEVMAIFVYSNISERSASFAAMQGDSIEVKEKSEISRKSSEHTFMHVIYFAILSFLVVGNNNSLIRAAMYFQIFIVVLLPNTLEQLDKKSRLILKTLLSIFLIVFYYLTVLKTNTYNIEPYMFFWE